MPYDFMSKSLYILFAALVFCCKTLTHPKNTQTHTHSCTHTHPHTHPYTYNISFIGYIECIIKIESVKKNYKEAETRNML